MIILASPGFILKTLAKVTGQLMVLWVAHLPTESLSFFYLISHHKLPGNDSVSQSYHSLKSELVQRRESLK